MPSVRPIWRLLRVVEHLLTGLVITVGIALGQRLGWRVRQLPGIVRWWHARLSRALGIQVEALGQPAPNALLVANHVSWLDVPILGSRGQIDFLSKAEVKDWPLIGWMAGIADTLFITRGANQTGDLIRRIAERISRGGRVVVFPEGTTTDGTRLRRFHPRLFGAGQLGGGLVQPVALRYGTDSAPDPVAPFIGDDALVPHLIRLSRHPGLRVQIRFLSPLDGSALSRRQISEHCRRAIGESLGVDLSDTSSLPVHGGSGQLSTSTSTSFSEAA
jgi:lyso-ornithine lipid O-acyltransferase